MDGWRWYYFPLLIVIAPVVLLKRLWKFVKGRI